MNRQEIVAELNAFPYDRAGYWIVAGGAMTLHGVRAETGDIDLGCTRALADRLAADAKQESEEQVRLAEQKAAEIILDAENEAQRNVLQKRDAAKSAGELRIGEAAEKLAEEQQHMRIAAAMKKEAAVQAVIEAILAG